MEEDLEIMAEDSEGFSRTRELLRENRWEISKRIFLYYPLIKLIDVVDSASKNLGLNGENMLDLNELFMKPVWDENYLNNWIGGIAALGTYAVLHNITDKLPDKTEKVISGWKKVVKDKAKTAKDKAMINVASLAGALAITFPADVVQAAMDPTSELDKPVYLLNLGMRFIGFNYVLNYATYLKKPRMKNFFDLAGEIIPGMYHVLKKDNGKLLDDTANIADSFNPGMRLIRSSMAGNLIKLGRYGDAMELYLADVENLDAMEKQGLVDRFIEYTGLKLADKIEDIGAIGNAFRHLPKKPRKFLNELETIASESLDARILYGVALNKIDPDEDKKEQYWQDVFRTILDDPNTEFKQIGESANAVAEYVPSRFVGNVFLFKEGSDVEGEVEKTLAARKLVEQDDRFGVPEPLGVVDGKYAFRRIKGELLNDCFDNNIFYDVADYLALIHTGMNSEKEKIDLLGYFNKKLRSEDFDLPNQIADSIILNYKPLIDSLEDSVYVFNKDAHPEQWIIAENGTIEGLDWEDKGLVPIQFDLVNLLEYGQYLNFDQKKDIINHYIDEYNALNGEEVISDRESFMIGYYNAVVHRAISFCSAWSSPDRPSKLVDREVVVDNAIHAIVMLELDHKDHYAKYERNYDGLRESLFEMLSVVQREHGS